MSQQTVNAKTMEQMVLDHMHEKGSITQMEANGLFKCRALPRRIATLKERGHPILSMMKKDSQNQRYVRYYYQK